MDSVLDRLRTRLDETRVFASAESRRRFLIHLALVAVVLVGVVVLVERHLAFLMSPEELQTFVRDFGVWSPVVLVLLQTLQVVLAPVPGHVLAVVAGYLFGMWWGTVYNMIGITIGSTIAFWLSRRFGRAYVETVVHEETLERFDAIDGRYARLTLLFFFVVPGSPDDVLCFVGGLTDIPLWQLVAIAIVGRTPAFFLVNAVGDLFRADQATAALVLAVALVFVSVLGYLNRDRIVSLVGRNL